MEVRTSTSLEGQEDPAVAVAMIGLMSHGAREPQAKGTEEASRICPPTAPEAVGAVLVKLGRMPLKNTTVAKVATASPQTSLAQPSFTREAEVEESMTTQVSL